MALNVTLPAIRLGVRKFANVQGQTSLLRHPDADLNDYINIALGSLHRRLTSAIPTQRILSTATITTEAGVSLYPLPANFDFLISVELTIDGRRSWLTGYEMPERAALTSPNLPANGIPLTYRLLADNIEFLPVPNAGYQPLLWYGQSATQLESDAASYDTICRLDEYVIAHAARKVAIKDKNWDLRDACSQVMGELEPEIDQLARNRDRNSPPRIIDERSRDRWGRSGHRGRRC